MREIKFRGKSVEKADTKDGKRGEWIFGGIAITHRSIPETVWIAADEDYWYDGPYTTDYEVDPETVGQYTGTKDINGREIYEGDVIKTIYSNGTALIETVVFKDGKFMAMVDFDGIKMYALLADGVMRTSFDRSMYMTRCEVSGNIHDNPELLGGM